MFPALWSRREKQLLGVVLLLVIISISVFFFRPSEPTEQQQSPTYHSVIEETEKEELDDQQPTQIQVDVKGAVQNPGIYELDFGTRVHDAIEMAGGWLEQADQNQVNLAQKCQDEMVIYVPHVGENTTPTPVTLGGSGQIKININTATAEELHQLNGIGPAKAEAIVKDREENGRFQSIEDLSRVPGIGEKTVEQLQDQVTIQ